MEIFQSLFLNSLSGPIVDLLDLKSEALASFLFEADSLQDSFLYRAKRVALKMAHLLIDSQALLDREALIELRNLWRESLFVLGPKREGDGLIYTHISNCLEQLFQDPKIWKAIQSISTPLCHQGADQLIRETLWPESIPIVEPVHVRRALIASWFTLLRQVTGSCFATAPAIWMQQKNPCQFFKDLQELLNTGQMRRIVGGKQYCVPLNLTTSKGALAKPSLGWSLGIEMSLESVGVKVSNGMRQKWGQFQGLTAEDILSRVLKIHEGVSDEDIDRAENSSRLQMASLIASRGAIYYQNPNEKEKKVAEWRKKLRSASQTFKSLTECALLRAWEYSIASFSDVKFEFARWNLYIGLGLHPEENNSVGNLLYQAIDERLHNCNQEIESVSKECQELALLLRSLEVSFNTAFTQERKAQIQSEWATHNLSFNFLLEKREKLAQQAEGWVALFPSWIEQYDQKLQEFFQELFDPELKEDKSYLYEDAPAGFRLFYTHGRKDASQWEAICGAKEYIEALRDFFSRMENELELPSSIERKWVYEITTRLIQGIQEPQFLAASIHRSKAKGKESPWAYVSGGTLEALLRVYCHREKPFTEMSLIPRSPDELLKFLQSVEKKDPLLMHSPTHAFIFYPSLLSNQSPELKKYENSKLFSNAEANEALVAILRAIGKKAIEPLKGSCYGCLDLYIEAKKAVLHQDKTALSSVDWDMKIADEMRRQKLLAPVWIFADTNWSGWFLGFIVNPNSGKLELWRLNRTGTEGFPMTDWAQWMDEQNSSSWTLLIEPKEYENFYLDRGEGLYYK